MGGCGVAVEQVQLKGVGGGIQAIVPAEIPDGDVARVLGRTLGGAADFLGRASVTVLLPGRTLTAALLDAVATAMAQVPDAALAGVGTAPTRTNGRSARVPAPHADHPIVHSQTLRAGQEIRHGGDVVVLGNVHRGARVIAEGNVIVLGRLEGMAHAGALGEGNRFIYAGAFAPTQVRIASCIAAGPPDGNRGTDPQGGRGIASRPEWARIENDAIVVEPWPGGPQAGLGGTARAGRRARPA